MVRITLTLMHAIMKWVIAKISGQTSPLCKLLRHKKTQYAKNAQSHCVLQNKMIALEANIRSNFVRAVIGNPHGL